MKGDPSTGYVALTFDLGGKSGGETGTVLDTLRDAGVHGTFFFTGEWVDANPALTRRIVAEGHELANHTYSHPDLTFVDADSIAAEMVRTEQSVERAANARLRRMMRPPFGAFSQYVLNVLGKQGYDVVYWTLDSRDWRAEMSVEDVANRVGTQAQAGDIVVFHAYAPKTASALPRIVQQLKARGLKLGTVSNALGADHR